MKQISGFCACILIFNSRSVAAAAAADADVVVAFVVGAAAAGCCCIDHNSGLIDKTCV